MISSYSKVDSMLLNFGKVFVTSFLKKVERRDKRKGEDCGSVSNAVIACSKGTGG